jgi:hypothetical protein
MSVEIREMDQTQNVTIMSTNYIPPEEENHLRRVIAL